jgi:hypothetical protein
MWIPWVVPTTCAKQLTGVGPWAREGTYGQILLTGVPGLGEGPGPARGWDWHLNNL